MQFKNLRRIKELITKYNRHQVSEKAELWFPIMFEDGQWSAWVVFGGHPELEEMWEILDYVGEWGLYSYFGQLNGDIALYIQ